VFSAGGYRKTVLMEQREQSDRSEETRDEPEPRDEDERKPGESDSKQAADKAPMKPGSSGAASRGSGPARAGS
jgi:hypothetical protein